MLWLLFFSGLALIRADICPPSTPYSPSCSTNALFVLDATNYLTNIDINNEMNFTWNYILPRLSFPLQQATFVAYGSGSDFTPLTYLYGLACSTLSNLASDVNAHGGQKTTLTSTMNQIYQDYRDYIGPGFKIILFSGSTDGNDINAAGSFVRNNMAGVQFSVVSLSYNGGVWNNFPYSQLYIQHPWSLTSYLGTCLVSNSCGANDCQTTPTPDTTTTTTTTTTPPPTTTPSITGPQCKCNYGTSWNDVMFLFESSYFVGNLGMQELLGYVQTSMTYFNIQKAGNNSTPYHTRIGIITYSDTATVVNPLGTLDSDDLMNIRTLPYDARGGTNIDLAFEYATNELYGANARSNARPVIVILGTTYSSGNYPLPQAAVDSFRRAGGVVVVYDYVQPLSPANPVLQNLTSPGYFIVNTQDNGHRLQDALCDANCKCPSTSQSYSGAWDTGKPTGGCFTAVETLGNYQVATNKCSLVGGTVAQGKTASQSAYIESLFSTPSSFLAGMKWDSFSNAYRWGDGTLVSGPYQPWYGNMTHQSGRDCVYVYDINNQLQWVGTDCRNGFFYACQAAPCDSTYYC